MVLLALTGYFVGGSLESLMMTRASCSELREQAKEVHTRFSAARSQNRYLTAMRLLEEELVLREEALKKARAEGERVQSCLSELAWTHFSRGDLAAAEEVLEELGELDGRDRVVENLFFFRFRLGELEKARSVALEVLATPCKGVERLEWEHRLARVEVKTEQYAQAETRLRYAIGALSRLPETEEGMRLKSSLYYELTRICWKQDRGEENDALWLERCRASLREAELRASEGTT